jgi:hypothetical protein
VHDPNNFVSVILIYRLLSDKHDALMKRADWNGALRRMQAHNSDVEISFSGRETKGKFKTHIAKKICGRPGFESGLCHPNDKMGGGF